jgi:hypothetical protein
MRYAQISLLFTLFLSLGGSLEAATGQVNKVLPLFLDKEGLHTTAPSLYARDAHQAWLRDNPGERSGLRISVKYKVKGPAWAALRLRVELRGSTQGNLPVPIKLETQAVSGGWFGHWAHLELKGEAYRQLGELTAWRATIWEGDELIGEGHSFLWE